MLIFWKKKMKKICLRGNNSYCCSVIIIETLKNRE